MLKLEKPSSSWKITRKVDTKRLTRSLIRTSVSLVTANWVEAITQVIDISKAIKKAENCGQKAYILILTALNNTAQILLIRNAKSLSILLDAETLSHIREAFDQKLGALQPSLPQSFFANPMGLDFLPDFEQIFSHQLQQNEKLTSTQIQSLTAQFRLNFQHELIAEWDKNKEEYACIKDALNTEFAPAIIRQQEFQKYYTRLASLFTQPTLNDERGMTLDTIYIHPHFEVHKSCFKKEDERLYHTHNGERYLISTPFIKEYNYPHHIHNYLPHFFTQKNFLKLKCENSQILLLFGQPGQGKTSFCYKLLYDLLTPTPPNQPLYFIKLRRIKNVTSFVNNPLSQLEDFMREDENQPSLNQYDIGKAILILDGLDELYMHAGLTTQDIEILCKNLQRETEAHSQLRIILTSRHGYVNAKQLNTRHFLILKLAYLNASQQHTWLTYYQKFYPNTTLNAQTLQEVQDEKKKNLAHIRELISQPILLHLTASADYKLDASANRAKIYDQLFDKLISREWATKEGPLNQFENLEADDLRAYIADIAFAIYQSEREYITKAELEALPATQSFKESLSSEALHDSLKSLMISFYFQEVEAEEVDKRNYAVEFLHKSLKEFLVSECIWEEMQEFTATLSQSRRKKSITYKIKTWEEALKKTQTLFTPKGLTQETSQYLIEIIQNDPNQAQKSTLADRLEIFLPEAIEHDFLYEYHSNKLSKPIDLALQCFHGYWSVLIHLIPEKNYIRDEIKSRFIFLIEKSTNIVNLSYQKFRAANLFRANLKEANLRGANLREADLRGANLIGANLTGVNLIGANLIEANLIGASLIEAKLIAAKLIGAKLRGASLIGANLRGANLIGANFIGTNLSGADLRGAKGLTHKQLSKVKSLYLTIGVPNYIEAKLLANDDRHLFDPPQ